MRRLALLAILLLAGCSWFYPPPPRNYARPAATEEQLSREVAACKEQARAVQQRDSEISQDIGSRSQIGAADEYFDQQLTRNVDAYASRERFQDIVSDCMDARGYGSPE